MDRTNPRTVSRNSSSEEERTPTHGAAPRSADTLADARGGPDADHHAEAAANALTDEEAGACVDGADEGGITPLEPRD